jgi:hypothetical protein
LARADVLRQLQRRHGQMHGQGHLARRIGRQDLKRFGEAALPAASLSATKKRPLLFQCAIHFDIFSPRLFY